MAFVLPVLLGFPWTLLLGVLILVPHIPTPLAVLVLLVVPPAINVFLILRTRGIVRAPREPHPWRPGGMTSPEATMGGDPVPLARHASATADPIRRREPGFCLRTTPDWLRRGSSADRGG